MYQDNETGQICAEVVKDRTKVYKAGTILVDPTLLDWQSVIDKNAGKEEFILKNDLDKAVDTEQRLYEKEAMELHNSIKASEVVGAISDNTPSDTPNTNIALLKKEIVAKRNALTPPEKKAMKEKLEKAGLPITYTNVTDADVLNQVLAMFN